MATSIGKKRNHSPKTDDAQNKRTPTTGALFEALKRVETSHTKETKHNAGTKTPTLVNTTQSGESLILVTSPDHA